MKLTWLDIERLIEMTYRQIVADGFRPDYVVGVAAGGLMPLYALSKRFGVANILTITVRSYVERERQAVEILRAPCVDTCGRNVLIVDDIADSGTSLKEVTSYIREAWRAGEVRSAVLCENTRNCKYLPNYAGQRVDEWVDFPWEIYERCGKEQLRAHTPLRVYIASDCGFSGDKRPFYYDTLVPMVQSMGFEVLDPWEMAPKDLLERARHTRAGSRKVRAWQKFNHVTGITNAEAITSSHVLLAILNGPDVDSGAASEIGYASAHGIPVIGYRDDIRLSGDNPGCIVNLQVEHFIHASAGRIYTTLHDVRCALEACKKLWAQ